MTDKIRPFDPAERLTTPAEMKAYLNDALESGHVGVIADALGVCIKAIGYAEVARQTGLNRQSLYRSFSSDGNPELGNVLKVAQALGVKLAMAERETERASAPIDKPMVSRAPPIIANKASRRATEKTT